MHYLIIFVIFMGVLTLGYYIGARDYIKKLLESEREVRRLKDLISLVGGEAMLVRVSKQPRCTPIMDSQDKSIPHGAVGMGLSGGKWYKMRARAGNTLSYVAYHNERYVYSSVVRFIMLTENDMPLNILVSESYLQIGATKKTICT